MKISTLTIEMAANVARLRQDMDRAQKTVDKAMGGITKAAKVAGSALAALGVGLSVSAVAGWVRGAINAADQMTKLAQKTGLAVNEVAGIQLAFRQSGVEATQLVPIMAKLSNAAVNGSDAFKAMGLQARNNDGTLKTTRQLLGEVAEKFSGYQDGAAKTALAVKLFGEEGAKLLPLLNQGAEGLAAYDETARRLGLTIDEQTGKAAERFNDTLDLLGQGTQGVARMIAAEMLPTLEGLAGQFLSSMTQGDRLQNTARFLSTALKGLVVVGLGVAEVFDTIGTTFGGLAAAAVAAATGNFRQAWTILKDLKTDIGTGWQKTLDDMTKAWNASGDAGVAALASTSAAARAAAPEVQKVAQSAKQLQQNFDAMRMRNEAAGKAYKAEQDALEAAANAYADVWEARQRELQSILDQVKAQEEANEAIGLSGVALAELEAARIRDTAAEKDRLAAIMQGIDPEIARAYQEQAAALRSLADKKVAGAMQDASMKGAQAAAAEWQKASEKIEDMLTDALMRGFENGKSFGQNLADSIKNLFKTYVAQAIAKAITGAIMAALAQTAWARALSGIFGGGGGGFGGMAMNAAGSAAMNSMFGGGGGAGFAASAGQLAGGVALNAMGAGGAGYAMAVPGLTSAAAGSQAAMLAAQTSGFGAAGVTATAAAGGSTAAAGASAASSALGAIPVWGWIALAAVVFWDDLFGRKLKEAGSMLKIRGDEITSTGYEFRSGGLFRSDKWSETGDRTAADQQVIQQFRNVQQSSAAMAQALGFSADTINGFTGTVRLNMKGVKTAEDAQKRLNEALEDFQWQLWRSVPGMNMTKEKFKEMLAEVQKAIEQAGISAQSIGDIIMQGMLGRMNQAQVGQALAEQVLGGIYQTIASPFAAQIASAFQAQIITPVFTAILANVPISQAISQQAIANVVATAQQAAATLNAIFSDAGFRQAIGDIQNAIGGIAAASVQPAAQVRGLTGAVSTAGNAAAAARAQWKSLADSIIDEIRRIRGEILGTGPEGLSNLQAQFALATAQARAGDKDAAGRLPELSRQLLDLARETSATLSDFRSIQGQTMASLESTATFLSRRYRFKLPSFDVGTDYVPQDMLAMVHKGERITPAKYNTAADDELKREVQELKAATISAAAAIGRLEAGMAKVTNGYSFARTKEVTA